MLSREPLPGREIAPGLSYWTAYHPIWKHEVGCVALDTGEALVLVDPLAPSGLADARRFWRTLDAVATGREVVHVLLTIHFHERSAAAVRRRYGHRPGSEVWAPAGTEPRLALDPDRLYAPGDPLPGGIEAHATARPDEVVLWIPSARALVAGDILLGGGPRSRFRVCPPSWLPGGISRADVAEGLEPLLRFPVELLVPLHGAIVESDAHATLAAALAEARTGAAGA